MAEEMMLEQYPFESDEAEDWESDEALIESDESAEDIGERSSRRQDRRPRWRTRGVRGVTVQGPNGPRRLQFPAKLATAAETNRGLASQEMGRRTLERRMTQVEAGIRASQKNDSSVAGIVTLLIGGGLSIWAVIEVSRAGGFTFGKWAAQDTTRMASLASVSQLATTGAKLATRGRYHDSRIATAADIAAGLHLVAFAFGSMYTPRVPYGAKDLKELQTKQTAGSLIVDARYITQDDGTEYETFKDANNATVFRVVH